MEPTAPSTTTTSVETIARWLAEPEAAKKIHECIRALERRSDDQSQEILRLRRQNKTLKTELGSTRHLLSVAERQLEGVDEDSFDPTKQKGLGAIPIGGDFSQIEAVERMLGMGPTLDEQMRTLGLLSAEEQAKRLGAGAETDEALAIVQAGHGAIPRAALGRILQVLWAARAALITVLEDDYTPQPETLTKSYCSEKTMKALVAAIDNLLPRAAFVHYLDLDLWNDWDQLPPLREP